MRCVNCGWDNKNPNATSCEKCGHPIQQEPAPAPQGDPYGGVSVPNYGNEAMPRPTVVNTGGNQAAAAQPAPTRVMNSAAMQAQIKKTVIQGSNRCPQCGFNLPANAISCPNCGLDLVEPAEEPEPIAAPIAQKQEPVVEVQKPVQAPAEPVQPAPQIDKPTVVMGHTLKPQNDAAGTDTNICDKCGTEVPGDVQYCPKCGERIRQKTIIVRRKPKVTDKVEEVKKEPVKCQLILIPEEEEEIKETTRDFEGNSIILNRDNTEPDNRTITSKEQAELTFEDGKWFIENRSALSSTFVQANRKIEVQAGDIIVLGDRRFKFETKTKEV